MINHYAFFIQNNHSSSFILKVVPVYDYIDPRVVIDVLSLTVYPTQYGPINPLGHSFYMSIIICIENTCSSPFPMLFQHNLNLTKQLMPIYYYTAHNSNNFPLNVSKTSVQTTQG